MSESDIVRRRKSLQIDVFRLNLMPAQLPEIFERGAGSGGAGQSDQRPSRGFPGLDPEHAFLLGDRNLVSRLETQSSPVFGGQDKPAPLIESRYPT